MERIRFFLSQRHLFAIAVVLPALVAFSGCRLKQGDTTYVGDGNPDCVADDLNGVTLGGELTGTVISAVTGAAIASATVQVMSGSCATPFISVTTDSSGIYHTGSLPIHAYSVSFSATGYSTSSGNIGTIASASNVTLNGTLSPTLGAGQIRIVLTWTGPKAGAVADIDSYLAVPGDSLPVFYANTVGTGANLDHDETNWNGPETITVTAQQSGSYVYYIHNYSASSDPAALGNSEAKVSVYGASGLMKTYTVPAGTGTTYEVFHLNGGVIQDVEQYNGSLAVW